MAYSLGPRAQAAGHRLIVLDECASTNTEALDRAKAGDEGPLWIVARRQSGGRGRRGRAWHSPQGNLAASFLHVVDAAPGMAATLGFAAGLALHEALAHARDANRTLARSLDAHQAVDDSVTLRIKWPNDILANDAKLAGILLEADRTPSGRTVLVIGFGVNVAAAPDEVSYPAVALAGLGMNIGADDLFSLLSDEWLKALLRWRGGAGMDDIRRDWLACAAGIGKSVSVAHEGENVEGVFESIDDWGRMVLVTPDGMRRTISAGDVFFGQTASVR